MMLVLTLTALAAALSCLAVAACCLARLRGLRDDVAELRAAADQLTRDSRAHAAAVTILTWRLPWSDRLSSVPSIGGSS